MVADSLVLIVIVEDAQRQCVSTHLARSQKNFVGEHESEDLLVLLIQPTGDVKVDLIRQGLDDVGDTL